MCIFFRPMLAQKLFLPKTLGARRFLSTSKSILARLEISKRDNVLVDERMSIRILDAPPSSTLTIHTEINDEKQKLFFRSVNEFKTDESSTLDLAHSTPTKGYPGIDPMGIFWSMERFGDQGYHYLMSSDVTQPLEFDIKVEDSNGNLLCSDKVFRHFLAPGVKRIKVKEGRIRGTLFLPPSDSPSDRHPCILNLYGGIHRGNVIEDDSAMLASRGFVSMSLAYFRVDDLPKNYKTLDYEYFDEAIEYLIARDEVQSSKGIGILGLSKGGDIAQSLACLRPDVIGAACIQNASTVPIMCSLSKNGVPMGDAALLDYDKVQLRDDGSVDIAAVAVVPDIDSKLNIPIEKYPGNVLWIVGEEDRNFLSVDFARSAEKRAQLSNKTNFKLSMYPGMGHFIRLPYTPLTLHGPHPLIPQGVMVYFGGDPLGQMKGQLESWNEKIQFFKDSLL